MPSLSLLSLAFSAGMIATLNPCGFAMLPAYVSYYLGREDVPQPSPANGLLRGLAGGLVMTTGVLCALGLVGLVISAAGTAVMRYAPWAGAVIGVVIAALGVLMLARRSLSISLPVHNPLAARPDLVSRPGYRAFFLFGTGYAVASLGCTLPIFLVVVTQALSAGGIAGGLLTFGAYGLGMGAVLLVLSVAIAIGRSTVAQVLRVLIPYVRTAGALGLVAAGGYLVYYQVTVGRLLAGL
ncbi:MAG: cytochrome c biogenesis protein CcdA [Armatimonadetes bacterium]|nr:cytochrome c biogenesis protein CcdA [Armatimonadota bacterium]